MFEQLEATRKEAKRTLREKVAEWNEAHREHDRAMHEWRAQDPEARGPEPFYYGPPEPIYEGPAELELNSAIEKARIWRFHLAAGLKRFRKR